MKNDHLYNKLIPVITIVKLLLFGLLAIVILHIVFWALADVYSTNRVIVDILGRLGLDNELSLPTWYSSALLGLVSLLAFLVYKVQISRGSSQAWVILSLLTLAMSIDEVISLHELVLQALHIFADFGEGQKLYANAWLLVLPVLLVFSIWLFMVINKGLNKDTKQKLLLAAIVYISGAFIVEYISIPIDKASAFYTVGVVVLEESLEIMGIILAVKAILEHINNHETKLRNSIMALFYE